LELLALVDEVPDRLLPDVPLLDGLLPGLVLLPKKILNGLLLLKELLLNELLPELKGLLLNELLPVELLKNVLLPELNGLLPLEEELPKNPLNGLLLKELLLKELLLPEKDPLLLVEL
jgi:hypothetical protein